MSRRSLPVYAVAIAAMVVACSSPRRFIMPSSSGSRTAVDVRGPLAATERIAANGLRLHDEGLAGLRREHVTDKVFSAELDLPPTGAVRMFLRTTVHDMVETADSGLVATIYGSGRTVVTTPSGVVTMDTPLPPTGPLSVRIVDDARWCTLTVGCTTLPAIATALPATEWIVVQTSSPSAVAIIDPHFHSTYSPED